MKYSADEKSALINRYKSGESISSISTATSIPKSTLYDWIKPHCHIPAAIEHQPTIQEYHRLRSHCQKLESMIEVLQTVDCDAHAPLGQKLDIIESLQGSYSVNVLCDALKVSRGTYYNHIFRNKRQNALYVQNREALKPLIQQIYDDHRQIYGADKITALLQQQGYATSSKTVAALMRELGLSSVSPESKHDYLKWKKGENRNILQQKFDVEAPNKVWVSDVTYLSYNGIKYYLCIIMDLFSRKIIAYRVSRKASTQLITKPFKQAYQSRQPSHGLIFHSDRGSIYTSFALKKLLQDNGAIQSLSRAGKPHDNAVSESFFSYFKKEEIYRSKYKSEADFLRSIDGYMQFYNSKRAHSSLQYKTPDTFEENAAK